MFDQATNAILCNQVPSLPTIIGEASLKHDVDDIVAQAFPRMRLCVVDDENTSEAFGKHITKALGCQELKLAAGVAAHEEAVNYIRHHTTQADALIAVGSGTISDLCKYASHLEGKPYGIFPTAASMNGYSSANASITFNGYKKTVAAHLPQAIFCDFSVITAAPARLGKSGLGDALARPTAQADWLLSHIALGTDYNEVPFQLVASLEAELFASARGIAKSDTNSIALLLKISLLSGFGMTIAGGSYPASQGEHMIAHAMEMLTKTNHLHGEEIGITTLTMARMQEKILRNGGHIKPNDFDEIKLSELFGEKITKEAKEAFKKKLDSCLRGSDKMDWDTVRERIAPIMLSPEQLEAILVAADAPTHPEMLAWESVHYKTATETARYLRDRFTFLDIQS